MLDDYYQDICRSDLQPSLDCSGKSAEHPIEHETFLRSENLECHCWMINVKTYVDQIEQEILEICTSSAEIILVWISDLPIWGGTSSAGNT